MEEQKKISEQIDEPDPWMQSKFKSAQETASSGSADSGAEVQEKDEGT